MIEKNQHKGRLLELDALRGIAALSVVLFHLTDTRELKDLGRIFRFGVTGVNLFFIISGFVIFLTLNNTSSWKDFVFSRFTRLYPTYWTCLSITALLTIVNAYITHKSVWFTPIDYLANLTMFQQLFRIPDLDGPYWTLIIELLFYICMLILYTTKKLGKIELIGMIALVLILLYSLFIANTYKSLNIYFALYFPLVYHFPLFYAGILFYKIKFERINAFRIFAIIACYFVTCMLFYNGGRARVYISQFEYEIVLLIYFSIWFAYVKGFLGFIVNRVTVFLGSISYSLYLIHQFLGLGIIIPGLIKFAHFPAILSSFIALVITIIFAAIITFYVEKPCIRKLKNWYYSRKGMVAAN